MSDSTVISHNYVIDLCLFATDTPRNTKSKRARSPNYWLECRYKEGDSPACRELSRIVLKKFAEFETVMQSEVAAGQHDYADDGGSVRPGLVFVQRVLEVYSELERVSLFRGVFFVFLGK